MNWRSICCWVSAAAAAAAAVDDDDDAMKWNEWTARIQHSHWTDNGLILRASFKDVLKRVKLWDWLSDRTVQYRMYRIWSCRQQRSSRRRSSQIIIAFSIATVDLGCSNRQPCRVPSGHEITTFEGLRSWWNICFSCRYSRAQVICFKIVVLSLKIGGPL